MTRSRPRMRLALLLAPALACRDPVSPEDSRCSLSVPIVLQAAPVPVVTTLTACYAPCPPGAADYARTHGQRFRKGWLCDPP